jgi:hypothetical protein
MEQENKNKIYDRLLGIKIRIEFQDIPSPHYINEKIGECHLFIEEVERYSIEISKEISVLSQAFNNAVSEYEYKKELLFETEDIKNLPSIKDRESRADSKLKTERSKILSYKNELTDLNNLLKQLNLKIRNLNRVNADIKMQIRILEAQIKMGGQAGTNDVTRSLVAEMRKGISVEDMFEGASSETTSSQVEDPSEPLDVDGLISNEEQDFTDPVPFLPDPDRIKEDSDMPAEAYDLPQDLSPEPEDQEFIDLDQAIDIKASKATEEIKKIEEDFREYKPYGTELKNAKPEGGEKAKEEEMAQSKSVQKEEPVAETKKDDHLKKEIDLDALLDSITI